MTYEDTNGNILLYWLLFLLIVDIIYYEGIIYIIYGVSWDSFLRRLFRWILSQGKEVENQQIETQDAEWGDFSINPFRDSVFIGENESTSMLQVADCYHYLLMIKPDQEELIESLKKSLKDANVDVETLIKSYNDMDMTSIYQFILYYLGNNHSDLVSRNDWEGFGDRIKNEWLDLFENEDIEVMLKNVMLYINDKVEKIEEIFDDYFRNHIHGEEIEKLSNNAIHFDESKSMEDRKKDVEKYLEFLEWAKKKYDVGIEVSSLLKIISFFNQLVDRLPNTTKKENLKDRSLSVNLLYNAYQWTVYYVDWHTDCDMGIANSLINNDYDNQAKVGNINFKFVNPILLNKVIDSMPDIRSAKRKLEDALL